MTLEEKQAELREAVVDYGIASEQAQRRLRAASLEIESAGRAQRDVLKKLNDAKQRLATFKDYRDAGDEA